MQLEVFRRAIAAHQRRVYTIAMRVTGDPGTAEEVTQDVFMELYRSAKRLGDDEHVRRWLIRVAIHRSTDALRKRMRQPEVKADEWTEELSLGPYSACRSGIADHLQELLQTIPEAMRVAVVLRYQEDMSPAEIADSLRQPVATVKSNLKRGLGLLRRKAQVASNGDSE